MALIPCRATFPLCVATILTSGSLVAADSSSLEIPAPVLLLLHAMHGVEAEPRKDGTKTLVLGLAMDLNADGVPEVIVEGRGSYFCGAANCATWVFGSSAGIYRLLLDAGSVQNLQSLPSRSNGYHDLRTWLHESATEQIETTYKFDGVSYRPTACARIDYTVFNARGDIVELKSPKTRRIKCSGDQSDY